MEKKAALNLQMFQGVNNFNGIDHNNLIIEGETDSYVPFVVRQLWFRSVYPKGMVKTNMLGSLEDTIRYKLCVFHAEAYDNDGKLLSMGHGSANTDEENFIETAERRAVSKALASAGFTWHNGDFSRDTDVSNTYLQTYNSYINTGIFDIADVQVIRLYEDALVTTLPEGYGADVGKPIAAMKEERIEEIAKNYAIINSGDPLTNAKIKFVYMYQTIEKQLEKQPKDLADDTKQQNGKKDKKRNGRRSKQPTTTDNVINIQEKQQDTTAAAKVADEIEQPTTPSTKVRDEVEQAVTAAKVTDEAEQPTTASTKVREEVEQAVTATKVIDEIEQPTTASAKVRDKVEQALTAAKVADEVEQAATAAKVADEAEQALTAAKVADEAEQALTAAKVADEAEQALMAAKVADEAEQALMAAEVVDEPFGAVINAEVIESDEQIISSYIDIDEIFDAEADDENFTDDLQTSLEEWGYNTIEELTNNWKLHMEKIKKRNLIIDWSDIDQALQYVISIPIYNNFLWADKAKKDEVVLLGEFLKKYQNETIEMLNNGTFPLPTLRFPIMWYIQHMG